MELQHSQNFIHNPNLIKNLLANSNISFGDTVIDIGAGEGSITKELAKKVGEKGKVIAIELENEAFQLLEQLPQKYKNVEVLNQDIHTYQFPKESFKVFSNIPFNITSDILNKLLNPYIPMIETYLVIQKEAAEMYGGDQIEMSDNTLKSLLAYPFYTFKIVHRFSKTDFFPMPRVNSNFLRIQRRAHDLIDISDLKEYQDFVSYIVQDRVGEGGWKKIFTQNQMNILAQKFGLEMNRGIKIQQQEKLVEVFLEYLKIVDVSKKNLVKGRYQQLLEEQNKLEKLRRTQG
ncbi:MAG TPA: rRNA adenine N(6)-methyltransferase family protein [Candidatus Dojkabacteria bacterium]|nr:rRNA adenine N(6)-methyltransferase family protein [Candidatus Dojkabacteria bacterium]